MSVIPFRLFSRESLIKSDRMQAIRDFATNERGRDLYAFILDSYDEGMAEDMPTPNDFIAVCVRVFNEHYEGGE